MNIEGTITNVGQSAPPDQKQCCRQRIQITNASGTAVEGFINWKKQAYVVGISLLVEATANQDGTFYFKRINPGYAQGGSQQQGSQQQGGQQWQQPQQQTSQGPTAKDILIVRQCCIKAATRGDLADDAESIIARAKSFEDYCLGKAAAQPSGANPGYEPNPDYDSNPQPPDDTDSIPF